MTIAFGTLPKFTDLVIEPLRKETRPLAGALFEALRPDANIFHPHDMTFATADRLRWKNDIYAIAVLEYTPDVWTDPGRRAIAYGMLRGWDAGFSIPSLGVAVHPDHRGVGLGRAMVDYLHSCARLRGAPAVRLKVYPYNERARQFYTSLGYQWRPGLEQGQLVGLLDLHPEGHMTDATRAGGSGPA